jgi:polyphosphate kinase
MGLDLQLADTALAWELRPDGAWERLTPAPGEEPLNCQDAMMETAARLARIS